jgi:hypothetical protein
MRYFTKRFSFAALLIASLTSGCTPTAGSKRELPACDSEDVTRISRDMLKVFGEYEIIKREPYNDPDGKQWCYAYYRAMGAHGLSHYEAYFTVEWVSQAEGRFLIQFKRGGVAYRKDVPAPPTRPMGCKWNWHECGDNDDLWANYYSVDAIRGLCRGAVAQQFTNAGFLAWDVPRFAKADGGARLGDFILRDTVKVRTFSASVIGRPPSEDRYEYRAVVCHNDINKPPTAVSVTVEAVPGDIHEWLEQGPG